MKKPRFKTLIRIFQCVTLLIMISAIITLVCFCFINVNDEINAEGVTEPLDSYTLRAMADHTIKKIHKHKGDMVKKGELIIEFDQRKLDDQIAQLQSEIKIAKAEIKVKHASIAILKKEPLPTYYRQAEIKVNEAKSELQKTNAHLRRCKTLFKEKAISKAVLELAEVNHDIRKKQLLRAQDISQTVADGLGESVLAKAESEYTLMKVKIEHMTLGLQRLINHRSDYILTAPSSGKLAKIPFYEGLFVGKGTEIAEIIIEFPKKIMAYVDEREIYKVKEGQHVRFTSNQYNFYEFGQFKGVITTINDTSELYKGHSCFPVELLITEEPYELKLGSSVDISIITDRRPMMSVILGLKTD